VDANAGAAETPKELVGTLQRYAGWLDRGRSSMQVRADVQALCDAIDACADASPLLAALDTNIARLPSGETRKMLRVTAGRMRRALDAGPDRIQ
jgi:hypothetical protein